MNKLEQAARQALEALIKANHFHDYEDEITALREALAEQAEQEPVAWVDEDGFPWKYNLDGKDWVPLYAAPVRTKDLTDDEIVEAVGVLNGFDAFRAVIAADREKNK